MVSCVVIAVALRNRKRRRASMMKEGCKKRNRADKVSDSNLLGGTLKEKKKDEQDSSWVKLYKKRMKRMVQSV